jgi:hypothetical protein
MANVGLEFQTMWFCEHGRRSRVACGYTIMTTAAVLKYTKNSDRIKALQSHRETQIQAMSNLEALELELLAQVLIEDSNWLDSFHSSAPVSCRVGCVSSSDSERSSIDIKAKSLTTSADKQHLRRSLSAPESRPDLFTDESQALQLSVQKSPAARNCITTKNIGLLKRAASSALCVKAGGVQHDIRFKADRPTQTSSVPRRHGLIPIEMLID